MLKRHRPRAHLDKAHAAVAGHGQALVVAEPVGARGVATSTLLPATHRRGPPRARAAAGRVRHNPTVHCLPGNVDASCIARLQHAPALRNLNGLIVHKHLWGGARMRAFVRLPGAGSGAATAAARPRRAALRTRPAHHCRAIGAIKSHHRHDPRRLGATASPCRHMAASCCASRPSPRWYRAEGRPAEQLRPLYASYGHGCAASQRAGPGPGPAASCRRVTLRSGCATCAGRVWSVLKDCTDKFLERRNERMMGEQPCCRRAGEAPPPDQLLFEYARICDLRRPQKYF